ncbi:DUF4124 domain-containing protein [Chitinimonas sp.]|uniref:DUF4124 domain-containing protein n=1 Tax=Chitinimonas sp. TaxID=1934313 RepID=UPI002F93E2FA
MKPYLLLALLAVPALADIYKQVDAEGRVTFSNIPMKGAQKLDLGPIPLTVPGPRAKAGGPRASANPSPVDFPKVDSATQKSRDQTKLQILQDELGNEQKLLDTARQRYAASPADARQRDNVTMHEKNIEALRKEIARVQ